MRYVSTRRANDAARGPRERDGLPALGAGRGAMDACADAYEPGVEADLRGGPAGTDQPHDAVGADLRVRLEGVTLKQALLDGLAPDGGLYVPAAIPAWSAEEVAALPSLTLGEIGARVLAPFVGGEIPGDQLRGITDQALDFPIPLVEVEPDLYTLELFHGPTLAFKDVAARVMARLFAAFGGSDEPLTVLVATSGDTGGAVAHAFAGVPGTRVMVLYPAGRVSPTQEAQLTAFNGEAANVRAYAVDGSFDDCQRLVKGAFADERLRQRVRLTSANSINIGRLLPQMIFYFHAIGQLQATVKRSPCPAPIVATPSGNFGNLTAGAMARRSGLPIDRFIAATNLNDVVPAYLTSGRFEPRASIVTLANAMDVGNPSNFERLLWLYRDVDAMRCDITGSVHTDEEIRETIRRVCETRGYLLDPHSAVGYLAAASARHTAGAGFNPPATPVMFLSTAHPAKFREIVEPIVGRSIDIPPQLTEALAKPRAILRLEASFAALRQQILA